MVVSTSLVKVKVHRGDPLNKETDIRSEMGHHKEQKEMWDNPTIYQWTIGPITRSTTWTNTIRRHVTVVEKTESPMVVS